MSESSDTNSNSGLDADLNLLPEWLITPISEVVQPGQLIGFCFSQGAYKNIVAVTPFPDIYFRGQRHIHLQVTVSIAQAAYEYNQRGFVPYASESGMQVEVPSCSDEVFFIPYEPGDLAPDPQLQTI